MMLAQPHAILKVVVSILGLLMISSSYAEETRAWVQPLHDQDYDTAIPILEISALEGDGLAAFNVAQLHDLGVGTPTDNLLANLYYKIALQKNIQGVELAYGLFLTNRTSEPYTDLFLGRDLLSVAAESGFSQAYPALSLMALTGAGGDIDLDQAVKWSCAAKQAGYDITALADILPKLQC